MTYNVFSGTLNPTHSLSMRIAKSRDDMQDVSTMGRHARCEFSTPL